MTDFENIGKVPTLSKGTFARPIDEEEFREYGHCMVTRCNSQRSFPDRDQYSFTIKGSLNSPCLSSKEVVVLNAKPYPMFPLRDYLPYGQYIMTDGTRVLFNRDYEPLKAFGPDNQEMICHPRLRIPFVSQEWFYGDDWPDIYAKPFTCQETFARCNRVLMGLEKRGRNLRSCLNAEAGGWSYLIGEAEPQRIVYCGSRVTERHYDFLSTDSQKFLPIDLHEEARRAATHRGVTL